MKDERHRIKVRPQGRLVIPAGIRKRLGLQAGDELIVRVEGESMILEKRENVLKRVRERFAGIPAERNLADELIAERRAEAAREDEA